MYVCTGLWYFGEMGLDFSKKGGFANECVCVCVIVAIQCLPSRVQCDGGPIRFDG